MKLRQGLLLATTIAVVVLVAVDAGPVLRAPLALALLLVGPGLAWTWVLQLRSAEFEGALAVALSVGVEILVGLVLLGFGVWTPDRLLFAVVVLVVAGVTVERLTIRRTRAEMA